MQVADNFCILRTEKWTAKHMSWSTDTQGKWCTTRLLRDGLIIEMAKEFTCSTTSIMRVTNSTVLLLLSCLIVFSSSVLSLDSLSIFILFCYSLCLEGCDGNWNVSVQGEKGSINISWKPMNAAYKYLVMFNSTTGSAFLATNKTAATIDYLHPNTWYSVKVMATLYSPNANWSNIVTCIKHVKTSNGKYSVRTSWYCWFSRQI